MTPKHPHGDPDDLAATYVAGGMSDVERAEFEGHLDEGCPACAAALNSWDDLVGAVFSVVEPLAPDPAVRQRLLERIDETAADDDAKAATHPDSAKPRKPPVEPLDLFVLRADEGDWKRAGIEGIQVRVLYVDREQRRYTTLVRMEPGAVYEEHTHRGAEECFVLEGDLHVGELVLRRGDYQRTPAGFRQAVQTTQHGCLLLLSTPLE